MEDIEKRKKIVIKIGSEITLNETKLNKIIDVIIEIKKQCDVIIVASGAIGFGRKIDQSIEDKQVLAALGQTTLMHQFEKRMKVAQILLTHEDLSNGEKRKNVGNTINSLLTHNVTPVINENDSTSTVELNLGDNDQLSSHVAVFTNANEFYSLTGANGVLDANEKNMKTLDISRISKKIIERFEKHCVKNKSNSGTGGILAKMVATIRSTQAGIKSFIVNGQTPEVLLNFINETYKNTGNFTQIVGKMTDAQIEEFEKFIKEKTDSGEFDIPFWNYKNK